MPYITQIARNELLSRRPQTKGELNYVVTRLLVNYVLLNGKNYQTLSDCMAALTDAREEFYRRVVAYYEDEKCSENGDVYGEILKE